MYYYNYKSVTPEYCLPLLSLLLPFFSQAEESSGLWRFLYITALYLKGQRNLSKGSFLTNVYFG